MNEPTATMSDHAQGAAAEKDLVAERAKLADQLLASAAACVRDGRSIGPSTLLDLFDTAGRAIHDLQQCLTAAERSFAASSVPAGAEAGLLLSVDAIINEIGSMPHDAVPHRDSGPRYCRKCSAVEMLSELKNRLRARRPEGA